MKSKRIRFAVLAMAAVLLLGAGIVPALAYEVVVKNSTGQQVHLNVYTRSDYSWDTFANGLMSPNPTVEAGATYTFNISVDSRHMCLSYVIGYSADYSKGFVIMGCDGTEENMASRCCANFNFEAYKKSDGTFHFRKQ